ncbi:hypothetical protein EV360DRAFT_89623 [Lentinula raphanica]|nr:hypothetical protein EV360DRAFT_89623 [Lentinula raphanica]
MKGGQRWGWGTGRRRAGGGEGGEGIVEEEGDEGKGNGCRDKGIEGCRDREYQSRTHDIRWYHPPSHSHHHLCKRDRTGIHALLLSIQHFNQVLLAVEITQVALLLVHRIARRMFRWLLSLREREGPLAQLSIGMEWVESNQGSLCVQCKEDCTRDRSSLNQISETRLPFPLFHALQDPGGSSQFESIIVSRTSTFVLNRSKTLNSITKLFMVTGEYGATTRLQSLHTIFSKPSKAQALPHFGAEPDIGVTVNRGLVFVRVDYEDNVNPDITFAFAQHLPLPSEGILHWVFGIPFTFSARTHDLLRTRVPLSTTPTQLFVGACTTDISFVSPITRLLPFKTSNHLNHYQSYQRDGVGSRVKLSLAAIDDNEQSL